MSLVVDIEKHYGTFDLEVAFEAAHETLGFLGASGCGKSLTLRCIAGVETPDAGKIVVNGKTYFDKAPGKKASVNLSAQERKSALLFQNYQLFPNLTVKANIAAGIPREVLKRNGDALIERQLTRFGLRGLEKRYPLQLSGGQQQRVALARMLAAQPAILMLDEPFSALDAHLKSELEQSLLDLFATYEGTILYVSHDIDEAFRFCDRIAVVSDGTIDEIAPKDELVHEPRSLAAIRLSGCKNTTPARYVSDHRVYLPEWGVEMETKRVVPHDVAWLGVRAYHIKQAREGAAASNAQPNVFRMRCDRVSVSSVPSWLRSSTRRELSFPRLFTCRARRIAKCAPQHRQKIPSKHSSKVMYDGISTSTLPPITLCLREETACFSPSLLKRSMW